MSAKSICPDCHIPIPAGHAVIRSISFQRLALCVSCAEDRGWQMPTQRGPLSVELEKAVDVGLVQAEAYANGVRQ